MKLKAINRSRLHAEGVSDELINSAVEAINFNLAGLTREQAIKQGVLEYDDLSGSFTDHPDRWPELSGGDEEFRAWPAKVSLDLREA